ncbi:MULTISPECIES: hypothetical protein [Sphingobacterium]|uniref:hypothetical protein n=1 Tax=Sphingobacterium TaxID=28453 RepID=UPI0013DCECA6|nr:MULTISPECIES: hypothetical protein [unclassified Sphingobacterium]
MAKSKDQLFAKIDNLLFDINSKYEILKSNEELNALELTLLEGDIHYLSNRVKALGYFVGSGLIKEAEYEPAAVVFTPPSDIIAKIDEQPVYEEIVEAPQRVNEEKIDVGNVQEGFFSEFERKEERPSNSEESIAGASPEQPIVREVVEEEKVLIIETETIAEQPARPLTINELIQQQRQAGVNITQQFQTSTAQERVTDLRTAVSLNDKLLFIKDLFNGYSLAYSEALELLNRFNNLAEADAFLQSNYALKNGWAEKPQSVDKFYVLLRKKFSN